jgi:quercetin dioxygenase-like cupin family protein
MSQPNPEQEPVADLAALYAAGALPSDECRAFEQLLAAGNAEAVAALRSFEPVVQALADASPPIVPPPHMRAALLQQIATIRPGDPEPPPRPALLIQRAFESAWEATPWPGVSQRLLRRDPQRRQVTMLVRMEAGATMPAHLHEGPEESLILEGDLCAGNQVLREGDYQFAPAGSYHETLRSETGCLALVIAPLRAEAVG